MLAFDVARRPCSDSDMLQRLYKLYYYYYYYMSNYVAKLVVAYLVHVVSHVQPAIMTDIPHSCLTKLLCSGHSP